MEKQNSDNVANIPLNASRTINISDRFAPLNEAERSKLVRMRLYKSIFSLFFGLITLGAVVFALLDYKFRFIGLEDIMQGMLILWTFPLVITLIMLYKYRKLSKDIKEGRKQIIVAPIEKKEHRISNKGINDPIQISNYEGTHYYYIWINGRKITSLDSLQFHRFEVGDLAELHIGPHSKRILGDLIKST